MSSTLVAHSPKFESKLTSYNELRQLPHPMALGNRHKPVPHAVLVDAIRNETDRRGWLIKREQFALGKQGAAMFGVIDLEPTVPILSAHGERGMSFGFRNSTDRSMAIKAVAGERVFVCDNLSMSGSVFSMERKNTTGLDLADAVARGFDKFLVHLVTLDIEIVRLQNTPVTDAHAKSIAYDVFASGVVPVRLFPDVEYFYFHPTDEMTDCQPRTLYGLHNAFTRALQDLTPVRMFGASVALSKHFGIKS